jgi:hypothetical protein
MTYEMSPERLKMPGGFRMAYYEVIDQKAQLKPMRFYFLQSSYLLGLFTFEKWLVRFGIAYWIYVVASPDQLSRKLFWTFLACIAWPLCLKMSNYALNHLEAGERAARYHAAQVIELIRFRDHLSETVAAACSLHKNQMLPILALCDTQPHEEGQAARPSDPSPIASDGE